MVTAVAWTLVSLMLLTLVTVVVLDALRQTDGGEFETANPMTGHKAVAMLRSYGIGRRRQVVLMNAVVVAFVGALVAGLTSYGALVWNAAPSAGGVPPHAAALKDILQVAAVVIGFGVAFYQWRLARYEASLEKYYDRLDIANRRLNTLIEQAWSNKPDPKEFDVYDNPPKVGVSLFDMWVFAELDNLEYVIQKYRRGYI
jgi:hypothetical protein